MEIPVLVIIENDLFSNQKTSGLEPIWPSKVRSIVEDRHGGGEVPVDDDGDDGDDDDDDDDEDEYDDDDDDDYDDEYNDDDDEDDYEGRISEDLPPLRLLSGHAGHVVPSTPMIYCYFKYTDKYL